jgi:hypothetical protein
MAKLIRREFLGSRGLGAAALEVADYGVMLEIRGSALPSSSIWLEVFDDDTSGLDAAKTLISILQAFVTEAELRFGRTPEGGGADGEGS